MNNYAKNINQELGVPIVQADGISELVLNAIYQSLSDIYYSFPLLKNVIAGIQKIDSFIDYLNSIPPNSIKWSFEDFPSDKAYILNQLYDEKYMSKVGITFYDSDFEINNDFSRMYTLIICRMKYEPAHTDLYTEMFHCYHEFGHVIDSLLHISNDPEFLTLTSEKNLHSTKEK